MAAIDELFETLMEGGGSDLHLGQGQRPKMRAHGVIEPIRDWVLTAERISALLEEICPPERWKKYLAVRDLDFAYALGTKARFRANYYYQQHGMGAIFRIIPTKILTLEQLKCPPVLMDFAKIQQGLILVTGPTGSGKSTTLAAIIDYINSNFTKHILTIEEPIEFVHPNKQSIIVQREVGVDAVAFSDALEAATRQDVDVILVGEMRDLETISLAVTAAEMGLLVFGTLHTNSASKTVDRIIDAFPSDQQPQIRTQLAGSLKGVCSQLLCKTVEGKRCAVNEILVTNTSLVACIRDGATSKIVNVIQSGKKAGMQLMDDAIEEKLQAKIISPREAYMKATEKERFVKFLPPEEKTTLEGG